MAPAEQEVGVRPRLAPHVRMRFDASRGQHVLLSPESILVLNATGAAIVQLCDGEHTIADIVAALQGRFDGVAQADVRAYVTEMVARRALEVG